MREGKRVDRQLRNGLVRARIGLVVEYMDRAVAGLQEVDVSGDVTRLVACVWIGRIEGFFGNDGNSVFVFKRRDILFRSQIGISTAIVTLSLASMKR